METSAPTIDELTNEQAFEMMRFHSPLVLSRIACLCDVGETLEEAFVRVKPFCRGDSAALVRKAMSYIWENANTPTPVRSQNGMPYKHDEWMKTSHGH